MNEIKNPFKAVKFLIDDGVFLELRDFQNDLWVITKHGEVWERELREWVHEPLPSSRSIEFLESTRLPYWEAVKEAEQLFLMKAHI